MSGKSHRRGWLRLSQTVMHSQKKNKILKQPLPNS